MLRLFLVVALIIAGTAQLSASDDPVVCNDQTSHTAINVSACDRAIASGQFNGAALKLLYASRGAHWIKLSNFESALADYKQALVISPDDSAILPLAFVVALMVGHIDDGVLLAPRILTTSRKFGAAHLVLGAQELKLKQYAAAQKHFKQSSDGNIVDLVGGLLSVWAGFGAGDTASALARIDKISGPDWYRPFQDFHAGLILDLAGRQQEAGVRLERAYKRDRSSVRLADAYARWLSRNASPSAAIAVYEELQNGGPNPIVQDRLRRLKAGEKLSPLVESPQQGAAELLYGIGAYSVTSGRWDLVLIYLPLALFLEPNLDPATVALADHYERLKAPQLAIRTLQRVSTGSPLWRQAQIHIAVDQAATDRPEQATQQLKALIADEPKDVEARTALGNIERNRKQFGECAETYSRAIEALPKVGQENWTLFYFRGICFERSNLWSQAEPDLRIALRLQPDQPQVLNYLGYSLIERGLQPEQSLAMIRRALEQRPDDGYIMDSLGWAYVRLGMLPEAEKSLRRAVELKREDPTIHRHLGDLFWRLGLKSQARAEWREARDRSLDPRDLEEIEARIADGPPDQASGDAANRVAAAATDRPAGAQPGKAVAVPAGRRVALVIGNSDYKSVPALSNPRRDARAVADALRRVGFQKVTLVNDLTKDGMIESIRSFAAEADKADWALIYYAGHGIELGGLNYLIPIDAKLAADRDVQFETVSLEQLMGAAEGARKLRIVMLDACRDNPFANQIKRTASSRSIGRGLAPVEPDSGMLLIYAAKHGQVAYDGSGENSPFVAAFLKRVATPQVEIRKLFDLVRDDVVAATERKQQPFSYGSVPGSEDFYFLTTAATGNP